VPSFSVRALRASTLVGKTGINAISRGRGRGPRAHYISTSWDGLGQAGTMLKARHGLSRVRVESKLVTARGRDQPRPKLISPALTARTSRQPQARGTSAELIRSGTPVDAESPRLPGPVGMELHQVSLRRPTETANLLPLPSNTTTPSNPNVFVSHEPPKTPTRRVRAKRLSGQSVTLECRAYIILL
jgi:hypothetical protein